MPSPYLHPTTTPPALAPVSHHNNHNLHRFVTRASHEVIPVGIRSHDFTWRDELKVGDEVDAVDCFNKWRQATIVKESKSCFPDERILTVGFRKYNNGLAELGDFTGLDSSFDQELSPHSPRILR